MTAEDTKPAPTATPNTELPKYRQMNPHGFYYDDTLWPEGAEFHLDDVPNEFLEPLNEPARLAMIKYLDYLDDEARKVAEKMGRPFFGRSRDFVEQVAQAREDALAIRDAKEAGRPIIHRKRKLTPMKRQPPAPQGHMAKRDRGPSKMANVKLPVPEPAPDAKPINILGKNFTETLPLRG